MNTSRRGQAIVTISSGFRIVIPPETREKLNLRIGIVITGSRSDFSQRIPGTSPRNSLIGLKAWMRKESVERCSSSHFRVPEFEMKNSSSQ